MEKFKLQPLYCNCKKNMKASVIIPNWNGQHLLTDCLESLKKQSFKDFELILVDNNSDDNSINKTFEIYPDARVIKLSWNFGFSKAINEGVKKARGEYVLFLNNDTKADEYWIENLVATADKHPEVVSVGSKLLNFYDQNVIDGLGISINDVGQAKSLGWQELDNGQFDQSIYIFGATGGGSLFRKEIFVELGMFDEDYFMYSEEVDFAFRAQFKGFKSIYCPKAKVFHKHKSTASKMPANMEYWQFKNMTQTIIKDFPLKFILKKNRWIKIIMVHINTIIYQIKNGFIWSSIRCESWLIKNFLKLLIKRYRVQKTKEVDVRYIESFFLEKKLNLLSFLGVKKSKEA